MDNFVNYNGDAIRRNEIERKFEFSFGFNGWNRNFFYFYFDCKILNEFSVFKQYIYIFLNNYVKNINLVIVLKKIDELKIIYIRSSFTIIKLNELLFIDE